MQCACLMQVSKDCTVERNVRADPRGKIEAMIAVQAKGAVKDVGKNLNPGSSDLPDPSAAADKAAGKAKNLASDVKGAVKGSNV